jgi:hypothetical protein
MYRSRIQERTMSLIFLGIILRVLRLEVSVYNVFITKQYQPSFAWGGGGGVGVKSISRSDCEQQGGKLYSPNYVYKFGLGQISYITTNLFTKRSSHKYP